MFAMVSCSLLALVCSPPCNPTMSPSTHAHFRTVCGSTVNRHVSRNWHQNYSHSFRIVTSFSEIKHPLETLKFCKLMTLANPSALRNTWNGMSIVWGSVSSLVNGQVLQNQNHCIVDQIQNKKSSTMPSCFDQTFCSVQDFFSSSQHWPPP